MKNILLRISKWTKVLSYSLIAFAVILFVIDKINIIDIEALGQHKINIMVTTYVVLIETVIILSEIQKNNDEFKTQRFISFVLTRDTFWKGCVPAFVMLVLWRSLYPRYYYKLIIVSIVFCLVMNIKATKITEFFKKKINFKNLAKRVLFVRFFLKKVDILNNIV